VRVLIVLTARFALAFFIFRTYEYTRSHAVILLAKKYPDCNIVNFDKLDYVACLENLDCLKDLPNYKFVKGDICSPDLVNYVLDSEKIDTIMHFAAQTHVDNSFGNSFQFTQNNIFGTHVLLESAKIHKIRRFVHVSTDEVYGEGNLEAFFRLRFRKIDFCVDDMVFLPDFRH